MSTNEIRYLGDMVRLERRPGDLFVLSTDAQLSREQSESMRTEWKRIMGDERLLIVTRGFQLGVVGATNDPEPKDGQHCWVLYRDRWVNPQGAEVLPARWIDGKWMIDGDVPLRLTSHLYVQTWWERPVPA